MKKYRNEGIQKFGHDFYDPDGKYNGCPLGDELCRTKRYDGTTPTFWEFTQAIIREGILDPHWAPIYSTCRSVYSSLIKKNTISVREKLA